MTKMVVAQGVLLSSGQSYVLEFTSLTYLQPEQGDGASFYAYFSSGTFSDGESVLVEMFPDSLFDSPLSASYIHVGPADPLTSYAVGTSWFPGATPLWPYLQGVARVTMLGGDGQLEGFAVKEIVSGNVYSEFFAVPEPSTLSLGVCVMVCLMICQMLRRPSPS